MRETVREFVGLVAGAVALPPPIYEFGALQVPGQEQFADLRGFFPGQTYVGSDVCAGPGVDVLLDLHALDLPDGSVGTAILCDTLEHVQRPWQALAEVYRVLAPGGVVLMTSTMNFRVHNYPADYWRYTPQAFEFLLEPFGTRLVTWAGEDAFPHLVAGVGWKTPVPGDEVERLRGALEPWRQRWFYPAGPGAAQSLKRFIPPVLLSWLRRVRGYPPPPSAMPWG